ncbi:MAG: BACON domain-containing protein [Saprospiraceae bacterium]
MKKIRLIVFFAGLLFQQAALGQDPSIEEFIRLNPSVLMASGSRGAGGQSLPGNKAVQLEINSGERSDVLPKAGPRYEKVRLLLPGTLEAQEYTVRIENGRVFLTDDIVLFSEADYILKKQEKGNLITFTSQRWPSGRIPYTIPFDHIARNQILQAIEHMNANTNLCMIPRTNEANYVEFIDSDPLCWSFVGMAGSGRQEINIANGCGFGEILHEILHAAGMWHEQSRNDRDEYVSIFWENIVSGREINFQKEGAAITAVGNYDYSSIMHYGPNAFSKNGLPTIAVKVPPASAGTTIGQRTGLSSGDIASVAAMYPTKSCSAPAVTNISLSAPITVSPNPIMAGQLFTVSTNFLNTGTTVFTGCYYAVLWDRRGETVEAILPAIQENNLPPNASYPTPRVFTGPALNVPTGEYILAIYFRNDCTGEYFFAANENFPSAVFVQVNGLNNLSVSPTTMSFTSAGGAQSVAVTSNTTWTITGKPDWITLSTVSGSNNGTVTVTAAPNGTASVRNAVLTFSAPGVTNRNVSITQQSASTALGVSPTSLSFPTAGGILPLSITSNTTWTATESLSWLSLSASGGTNSGTINVSCTANPDTAVRTGIITFTGIGALTQTVTVTQQGASLFMSVAPSSIAFAALGSSQNLNITSNTSWFLSESLDWLSLSTTSGNNNGTVVVTSNTNPVNSVRSGTITVSGAGVVSQTVTVSQSGNSLFLTLSTNSMSFVAGGGNNNFTITSNTSWNVSPSATWVTVSPASGNNNGTIAVTCAANTTTSARTSNISIWGTGVATQLITITQEAQAPFVNVSPTTLDYNAPGGSLSVAVTSNTVWTVSEGLSWISVAPDQGTNNGSFSVLCTPNTANASRSGIVTVSASGAPSRTIVVNQSAATAPCAVPGNVALVQKGYSWFYVNWSQVPGINVYSWRFRAVGDSTWRTNDFFGSLGLISMVRLPCTEYIFQVRAVCSDTFSDWSPELRFTLEGCGDPYCYSYGSTMGDWIARVGFAGIGQVSSTDYGYVNRTSVRGTVTAGETYPISLIGGFDSLSKGTTYHWKAWIDFNRDNDFNDAGETVFSQTFSRSASVGGISGTIPIPLSATPGSTRMRVAMSLEPGDGPCATGNNYREVEDYGLDIQSGGAFISISPSSMDFPSGGGNQSLALTSNTTWTISDTVAWVSVAPAGGSNNGTAVVTCSPNTSTNSRSTTVTIAGTGATTIAFTVTQAGAPFSLSVSPTTLNFNAPGGTNTFTITSNTTWTVGDTLGWTTISPASGENNRVITVTCTPNPTNTVRSGLISVFGLSVQVQTIAITQAAASTALTVSPAALSFNAGGGTQSLNLTANTGWVASNTVEWVTVAPAIGSSDTTVQVTCAANTGTNTRSGSITFLGVGAPNQTVNVTQSGLAELLEVSPATLNAGPQAGSLTLSITSNGNWNAVDLADWVTLGALSGTGNATLVVNFAQNTTTQQRSTVITITSGSGALSRTVTVTQRGSGEVLPNSWNFKRTENNHIIILQSSLVSSINGAPLAPGDYVGVFFTLSGTDICAGNGPWTGNSTSFPVFGDDTFTAGIKDGMGNGETFKVKIWRGATQQTIDVNATYAPIGTAGIVNATNAYLTDGFSMITALNASSAPTPETLAIPLKAGWNMISSYIVPQKPSFDTIVKPMSDVVQVVKDGAGNTFLVGLNLNNVGDWEITQGYRVQVTANDTLFITGIPVNPLSTPIPVQAGWQIIPVFSRNPISTGTALASLDTLVEVLKDNDGRVYIPNLSINTIGQMIPTQGYRLKAKSSGELRYPALAIAPTRGEAANDAAWGEPAFFTLSPDVRSGANATVVFLAPGLSGVLEPGDEVGIFGTDGRLYGAGQFTGAHLAVAVWGDEPGRAGGPGLRENSRFEVRAWKRADGKTILLEPVFSSGGPFYHADALSVVQRIAPLPGALEGEEVLRIFPNPGNGQFTLIPEQSLTGPVQLSILDSSGKMIFHQRLAHGWSGMSAQQIDISRAPAGIYLVQVISEKGIWTKKMSLVKMP